MTTQTVWLKFNKNFELIIMNLKKTTFAIEDKNLKILDNEKDYPTFDDLMREQNSSIDNSNTVHHRRDLDSLG